MSKTEELNSPVQPLSFKAVAGQNGATDIATASTPRANGMEDGSIQSSPSANAITTKSGVQTRQKRVLPSRSRRGGPGVGSCDMDLMILDTLRRKQENEPLIPASTRFILTTNQSLVPSTSNSASFHSEINSPGYTRYFDRPEVQTAYRAQETIQTPEFTQLDEDANVGGRFRPRGAEDESADTSDAAYEKRHRKYETFEKRQRLREKEKLKHEQYKLKERIEQLRAMDTAAFLALPATDFPESTEAPPAEVHDEDDAELGESSNAHFHGTATYIEGERRRRQMLDVASSLEERYRTLLPSKYLEKKLTKAGTISTTGLSLEPESPKKTAGPESSEDEEEEDELIESDMEQQAPASFKAYHDEDGESEVDMEERDRQRSKGLKLRIKFTPRTPSQLEDALAKQRTSKKQSTLSPFLAKSALMGPTHSISATSILTASPAPSRPRGMNGKFLKQNGHSHSSASVKIPPRKRQRLSTPVGERKHSISAAGRRSSFGSSTSRAHASHAGAAGKTEQTTCLLMVAALRNSAAPNVRKTQRHVTAFGTKVPPEIEEMHDFVLPDWVLYSSTSRSSTPEEWRAAESDDIRRSQTLNDYGEMKADCTRVIKHEPELTALRGSGQPPNDEDHVQIAVLEH